MNDCYDSKCVVGVVLYVYVHVTLHVPEGILRADAQRPHIILLCALKNAQRARVSSRNESNVSSTPHTSSIMWPRNGFHYLARLLLLSAALALDDK